MNTDVHMPSSTALIGQLRASAELSAHEANERCALVIIVILQPTSCTKLIKVPILG